MSSKSHTANQAGATAVRKPTETEIAVAAHHIHVQNGSRPGHDLEDWLKAEQLLAQHMEEVVLEQTSLSAHATMQPPSPAGIELGHTTQKATRDDIRRQTTAFRPASRQTHPSKHSVRTNA